MFKDDYVRMTVNAIKITGYSKDQVEKWDSKTKVSIEKKYVKVVKKLTFFVLL